MLSLGVFDFFVHHIYMYIYRSQYGEKCFWPGELAEQADPTNKAGNTISRQRSGFLFSSVCASSMPKQTAARVGLPYNQGLMRMAGVQAKTPQYGRFHQVYYKILLSTLPDNCQGAKVLTQVQHVLLQAYGRLLLKCDVWDAFATLSDDSPTWAIANTDSTPGGNKHSEFRVEESSKRSVRIQRHRRPRVMEHMIIPEWEIYKDNAQKN